MSESDNWQPPKPPTPPTFPEFQYANFGERLIGRICDALNFAAVFIGSMFGTLIVFSSWAPDALLYIVLTAAYVGPIYLFAKWLGLGGSPLRRKLGIYIVDENSGSFIGTPRGFLRLVFSFISGSFFYLGFLWMLWDPKKQTWHDKIAKSVVVKR